MTTTTPITIGLGEILESSVAAVPFLVARPSGGGPDPPGIVGAPGWGAILVVAVGGWGEREGPGRRVVTVANDDEVKRAVGRFGAVVVLRRWENTPYVADVEAGSVATEPRRSASRH